MLFYNLDIVFRYQQMSCCLVYIFSNIPILHLLPHSTPYLQLRNEMKMARAYELGEMGLNDALLARRQGMEARLSATLARFEAAETYYRLLLDTHQLWPLGNEEGEGHH